MAAEEIGLHPLGSWDGGKLGFTCRSGYWVENRWEGSETEANHEMEIMTYILDSLSPEEQPDVRHPHLPNIKPLPSVESLGPPPPKPPRPPVVTLQAFQRQAAALSKPDGEGKKTHRARAQPAKGSHGSHAPISPSPPPPPPSCINSQGTVPNCFSVGMDIHHCLFSNKGCGSLPVK